MPLKAHSKIIVLVAALTLSSAAHADISALSLGLRTGYGVPLGSSTGFAGASLSNLVKGVIPIWVDAGYRFGPFYVGAFFQYGIGLAASNCIGSCSTTDLRFGVDAHFHFLSGSFFDPWVGLGLGYESLSGGSGDNGGTFKGFEFINFQVGGDFMAAPSFSVGPFIASTISQYSSATVGGLSQDITNKGTHVWLLFGVRGVFDLAL